MSKRITSTVIGYLGGCFGNSLATLIKHSVSGSLIMPNENNFHVSDWPYDMSQCMLFEDSCINLNRPLSVGECLQVHCLNGKLLCQQFPSSKKILLTCTPDDEFFAMQRQWKIFIDDSKDRRGTIMDAWDWVSYHLGHYCRTGRIFDYHDPKLINIDFQQIIDRVDLIEEFLDIKISESALDVFTRHMVKQKKSFYQYHPDFKFAWDMYQEHGPDALIEDLARERLAQ